MTTATKAIDRDLLERYRQALADQPELGRRSPTANATWLGGDRSEVRCDGATIRVNGDGNLSPMSLALAALAACDVVAVAVHASLLGIEVEDIAVEVTGGYDARALLGVEGAPSAGFDSVAIVIRITAPGASTQDLQRLREAVESASQVGASLTRPVPVTLTLE
jgi:uncharacterized OsmC-like protein